MIGNIDREILIPTYQKSEFIQKLKLARTLLTTIPNYYNPPDKCESAPGCLLGPVFTLIGSSAESDPRITNVRIDRRTPCDRVALSNWEQKHSVSLPEDLRNFYASTDGFQLNWDYKYSADEILPVGSIHVNTLNELCMSSGLKDLVDFALTRQNSGSRPVLNTKSKIFELDDCRNIGKICLIYSNGSWSIWLVTRDGAWGWLADSFTHYFRMALVHLGLPGWQAAFANLPLIPWAEQLFLLLAPYLLDKTEPETAISAVSETGFNHIDPNIFKTTSRHHKNSKTANH